MLKFAKHHQEIIVKETSSEAKKILSRALELVGKLKTNKQLQAEENVLRGSMRYGLQGVPIVISLENKEPQETIISIDSRCDDVHGEAAKESISRLMRVYQALSSGDAEALEQMLEKDSFLTARGISMGRLALLVAAVLSVAMLFTVLMYWMFYKH